MLLLFSKPPGVLPPYLLYPFLAPTFPQGAKLFVANETYSWDQGKVRTEEIRTKTTRLFLWGEVVFGGSFLAPTHGACGTRFHLTM